MELLLQDFFKTDAHWKELRNRVDELPPEAQSMLPYIVNKQTTLLHNALKLEDWEMVKCEAWVSV